MNIRLAIQSQYFSAIAMLKQAIVKCPPSMWDSPKDKNRFWFTAYHALYFAHLYLQPAREDFVRWRGHGKPSGVSPLSKDEILEYLAFVEQEVARLIPAIDLNAPSGFQEIHVDKVELQLVSIRHIQQHTGELYERLGTRRNIKLTWAEQKRRRASKSNPARHS